MSGVQEQMISAMDSAKEAAASVGERVSDFFQGNPFSTPVGHKIEMATDATKLTTENWGLNMEICDYINNTTDGGRDAIRAIKKRLHTQMCKNNAIVCYALTVLETCVKNCDHRFHELVMSKDFVNELVKLIGPKFDAPQAIQERILSLIQSWNDAFRNNPTLQGVCQVYDELKAKGVQFPVTDRDSTAPIITPKQATGLTKIVQPMQPVNPTPQQLEKLRKELDIVNSNLKVLREMLSELTPGKEDGDDIQLLTELYTVCKEMQTRILDLIRSIVNDEVTYELLVINDEFNNVFEKYDRYMANRSSDPKVDNSNRSLNEQLEGLEIKEAGSSNTNSTDQQNSNVAKSEQVAPISDNEAREMSQWLEAQKSDQNDQRDLIGW
uniref:VHS domain-containing protein n=1 Tax=Syphacia muris TaxID=451379 RepID=A0A0N5AD66_9BILA